MEHRRVSALLRNLIVFFALLSSIGVGWGTSALAQARFEPDRDHAIDLRTAVLYTNSLRQMGESQGVRAVAFGREAVLALLNQPGCSGIRIYQGIADRGRRVLVLVGVDLEGKDMYLGTLNDRGYPCPPVCDETSPLDGK
jgi:hypothetical protein